MSSKILIGILGIAFVVCGKLYMNDYEKKEKQKAYEERCFHRAQQIDSINNKYKNK